jgi:hypothetical protein
VVVAVVLIEVAVAAVVLVAGGLKFNTDYAFCTYSMR